MYMKLKDLKFPHILLIIYILLFVICSINPFDRGVWLVENLTVLVVVLFFVLTYKYFKFSNTAYLLISIFIFMHTIGGHYSFARVPFDFITNLFGFERNNYDRFAHFSIGLYAYAMAEFLYVKKIVTKKWALLLFPIFIIMSLAVSYEWFEWLFAVIIDPTAGIEILGAQGDIWDAQKDMLCDTLGAIIAIILFYFIGKFKSNSKISKSKKKK